MIKYRGKRLVRTGFMGLTLIILIIAIGLQPERLVAWATSIRHTAIFTEAAGLQEGNDVKISGVTVGTVTDVSLDHGKARVDFTVDSTVSLGAQTTAHIRTGSLLGERMVTLESAGSNVLRANDIIPVARTSSPYSLTDAVGDLTTNVAGTDTRSLNHSLDVLADTIDQIAPQLGSTFDGLIRISSTLNARDETVTDLLKHTGDVTSILAQRSDQVNTMILNANDLTDVLVQRRQAIIELLAGTSALAQHLAGLVTDNEKELAPTLDKLNTVTEVLVRNRDNLAKALPGLAKYESGLSEIVASGPYYTGYIPNLTQGVLLQPFLDYAFGFRRGTNPGPDSAGPRAEVPFPRNGIPQAPQGGGR